MGSRSALSPVLLLGLALPAAAAQDPLLCHQAELPAADGATGDLYGWSIALEESLLVVGAPYAGEIFTPGSAYAWRRGSAGAWAPAGKIEPSIPLDAVRFGDSDSVSDGRVLVGAPDEPVAGLPKAGVSYVFEHQAEWTQVAKLVASDADSEDGFGEAVALRGETAVVGSPNDENQGEQLGSAYVFVQGPEGWEQAMEVYAPDGAAGDGFGSSLAVDGEWIVVGSLYNDGAGANSGAVYVFHRVDPTTWTLEEKLVPADGGAHQKFGAGVGIHGGLLVAGAPNASTAYLFSMIGAGWTQLAVLGAGVPSSSGLGQSVAVYDDSIAVGAYLGDGAGWVAGTAHAYEILDPAQLTACPGQLSLASGGAQQLDLSAGAEHALDLYLLVGSETGTSPGIVVDGILVPLALDRYTAFTASSPNQAPLIDTLGILDGGGGATMKFEVAAGSSPSLAGKVLHHVAIAIELVPAPKLSFASNPTHLTLEP